MITNLRMELFEALQVTRDTWPHLDHPAEGEGEGDADQEEGDEGQQVRDKPWSLLAALIVIASTGAAFQVAILYQDMLHTPLSRAVTQLTL